MHVPTRSNASAKTACDLIVAQINVRAAGRANGRSRRARHLLFPFTLETLDNRTALSLPKILEPAEERGALWYRPFFRAQPQARFRLKWQYRATARPTKRAFC